MNIILTSGFATTPLDEDHTFVTTGLHCWGAGRTVAESLKNAKAKGPRCKQFVTRVAPLDGFHVNEIDGGIGWNADHGAKDCPYCTVGKGITVNTDKTFKEEFQPPPKGTEPVGKNAKGKPTEKQSAATKSKPAKPGLLLTKKPDEEWATFKKRVVASFDNANLLKPSGSPDPTTPATDNPPQTGKPQ